MSKTRCLPERTVDAWVSAVVTKKFPCAAIWAPSQMTPFENYDFDFNLGEGNLFILEDKGAFPRGKASHGIEITQPQLDDYCDTVEGEWEMAAYYVLPRPPRHTTPVQVKGTHTHVAHRIRSSDAGPFEDWAFVISCHDLRRELVGRFTHYHQKDRYGRHKGLCVIEAEDPIFSSDRICTLTEFLKRAERGEVGTPILTLNRKIATQGNLDETSDVSRIMESLNLSSIPGSLMIAVPRGEMQTMHRSPENS